MIMLFLLQPCQKLILTLLKKLFKKYLFIPIGIFAFLAKQRCRPEWVGCYVVNRLRCTTTAAWLTLRILHRPGGVESLGP